jgi:hypothetical protein
MTCPKKKINPNPPHLAVEVLVRAALDLHEAVLAQDQVLLAFVVLAAAGRILEARR